MSVDNFERSSSMALEFTGELSKQGTALGRYKIEVRVLGDHRKRYGVTSVPMSPKIRTALFDADSIAFSFKTDDGQELNLRPARHINIGGDRVVLETSGRIPGM
ncbi:hypothetical protein Ga0058931_2480 [Roseibaca calidilacus]|uniref:Uncharacterized protein n=1 Tax=Roseibaca calidilacus TaxID=1666912 RepID=A0ABP2C390_9RHOB|nr:hypothetical protein Ga0058931_2480 [Roseibaca calidilacus]